MPSTQTPRTGPILGVIVISYFMILMDNSVIFTALPRIASGLQLSAAGLSWVQDAYTLVFGGLLLLGARAGDILGRRRLFIVGLVVFSTSSFMIGVAPAGWWLIGWRAVQGIGAAIVAPTSLALITSYFPAGPQRNRAVAWYAATAGIGASAGLLVGGACASWISWRAGFFINVPIGIAMIVAAMVILPETDRRPGRFDTAGAIAATAGVGALVFGIIWSADHGWANPVTWVSLAAGLALLALLVANEAHAEQPIMPLHLFADRERCGAYAVRVLYLGAMIGFFFFTTQYLQDVLGFTPLQAGLGFLPMTMVNFVVAVLVPRVVRRFGNGATLALGTAVTLLGMAWLSRLDPSSGYVLSVALPMMFVGAGQGLAFAPLTSSGIVRVQPTEAGAASGLLNTAHQIGSAMGLSVLVAVTAHHDGVASAVRAALTVGSGFLAVALVLVLVLILPRRFGRVPAAVAVEDAA